MKKIKNIRIFISLLMIITACICFAYFLKTGNHDRLFPCIVLFPIIFVPNILDKMHIKLTEIEKLIYIIFILLAQVLGSIINLYKYIWWYDLFVHFLSGIITFILAGIISKKQKFNSNLVRFIYFIGFVALIAIFWEIIEFSSDVLFKSNMQHNIETGVRDTMEDMIVAILGGLTIYTYKFRKVDSVE